MTNTTAPRFEVNDRIYFGRIPGTIENAFTFLGERLYHVIADDPTLSPMHLVTGNALTADVMGWVEFETDISQITPEQTEGTMCRFCWAIIPRTGKAGRPASVCAECKANGVHN